MTKHVFLYSILFFIFSCKIQSNTDNRYSDPENKKYRLRLNPEAGSRYYFDIINESEMNLDVEGKEVENRNKSTVGMYYDIQKDSAGNFLFNIQYDKVRLYTKSGETETAMDADNAGADLNPVEKMLGSLKGATIVTTVNSKGEIKEIKGYRELGEKIISGFDVNDVEGRALAQSQWEKMVGESFVKKSMDQLFTIFPDSTVRVGDKWKLTSDQSGEINLQVKNIFNLKAINDDIALIESEGDVYSDNTATNQVKLNNVDLKGQQQGTYEMNTKTGILVNCKITSTVEGTIQMMGKEIPVEIESTVKVNSRKIR